MKAMRTVFAATVFFFGSGLAHAETPATSALKVQAVYQRAMRGDALAQFQLASFYEKGQEGVSKDLAYALSWYEESAHNGFAQALKRLKALGGAE